VVRTTCWKLKFHLLKATVLPTFTYETEIWEGDLNFFSLEGFWKGHEDTYDVLRQSMCFNNLLYFVGCIWRTPHNIIRFLSSPWDFNNGLPTYPPLG
jgi:hypothetical protein